MKDAFPTRQAVSGVPMIWELKKQGLQWR
jgi:hypothetical protein